MESAKEVVLENWIQESCDAHREENGLERETSAGFDCETQCPAFKDCPLRFV